jgi:predicted Zn-dependent protease
LADPAISALWVDPRASEDFLRPLRAGDATGARLRWLDGRTVVVNSRGLARAAAPTAATLEIRLGRTALGEGAGGAAGAARALSGLPLDDLSAAALARSVEARGEPARSDAPMVLSPEATARFFDALARALFAAHAYRGGGILPREHWGVQMFDRALSLRDDGLDPAGLAFPFDLDGSVKRPVDLVRDGAPRTPTLDERHAALLGLPATAHASGGDDAMAENLFVAPGQARDEDLLAAAGDGTWIGRLESVKVALTRPPLLSARAQQLRAIRDGRLAGWLPDALWTVNPLNALARLPALGAVRRTLVGGGSAAGLLGATTAPGVVLGHGGELREL